MDPQLEQARDFFLAGVSDYQGRRFESAERNFTASLALAPGRPSTLTNLGATRLKLGRGDEALALLDEALVADPDNTDALGHRAMALAELGKPRDALAAIERALAINPKLGAAWTLRGTVLRDLGDAAGAVQSYRTAIAHGADSELLGFYIAGIEGSATPDAPPPQYVQSLFDHYADGFEKHLVEVLKYQAPQVLAAGLARAGRRFECALDLGCGTGLCGVLLRESVRHLDGVDLSPNMVRQAQARGVYDEVTEADIVVFLRDVAAHYDLVIAADVFIYVGALESAFARVAAAMKPGGVFCFSVEAQAARDLVLRRSFRYAHSAAYIERLAAANGFDIQSVEQHAVREDQRVPIAGLFYWLVKR
ncbi:tetratricopeptide repeat protein [Caenimonas koreensis DSM 17982]|uniref:Tetratricopeptide repeat protein n=1 Tax=Caenimonas koreensis DSM 17982 TaxID=1121255 RepID=A0A844BD84_9BURK|nr:tetratricopeptide repeat protein [Caenimonas koreensis]MRD49417.1 tetratricopeptide repeat protein [Caenimonas koreensis DSM 17982]